MLDNNNHNERERLVIELYKNQNKSIREIAKIVKMSFRDIGYILKKEGLSHGLAMIDDDNNNKKTYSNNEKATQAYKLFSEGKKPVEVAIQLCLSERQATRYYTEYWRLKREYRLYELYRQIEHCLPSFLKLHKASKKMGLNPDNIEQYV